MFQTLFCDLKTGSLRRLPYFGYSLILLSIIVFVYLLTNFLASPGMEFIRLILFIPMIIITLACTYASFVLGAKRLRNIGFQKATTYSLMLLGFSIIIEIIIAFSGEHAFTIRVLYSVTLIIIESLITFTPENFIGRIRNL